LAQVRVGVRRRLCVKARRRIALVHAVVSAWSHDDSAVGF
jgi:hypothetical protein